MKLGGALLFLLSLSAISPGQTPPSNSTDPADVAIVKFSWNKERINWEGDPFGGPVENFDDMRVRTRNDRRVEVNKGSAEESRIRREAKADAANIAIAKQPPRPRYVFVYELSVKNASAKSIKAIDWDYVFFDTANQAETGRLQISSEEKIAPGKSKGLKVYTSRPPNATVSAHSLNDKERQNMGEQVFIMRIVYSDGSVWQRP
jgi:uncharacterized protein affecting Mg2+/Co2+ transport